MTGFKSQTRWSQVGRLLSSKLTSRQGKAARARANAARDRGDFAEAAMLYELAIKDNASHAGLHIQCGHMFKEAGQFAEAESHYLEALSLTPNDADLNLQLGHFYKVVGRVEDSMSAYARAAALAPGWREPSDELAILRHRYGGGQSPAAATASARSTHRGPAVFIERIKPSGRPRA